MFGRALGYGELRRLEQADQVFRLARAQQAAKGGWVTWNKENPAAAEVLEWAAIAAKEMDLLDQDD
ncbi:MAG: hypothetical protein KIS85_06285 [Anaerolineales bacterium]|nr:hypothetical protein [Anaerolineales bacterium]